MGSNSRATMIRSAAALFGSRGLSGTSFSDVLADSGARRGSIYHHFPGGKKQLAEDAIGGTSQQVLARLRACPAGTPAAHGRPAPLVPRRPPRPAPGNRRPRTDEPRATPDIAGPQQPRLSERVH